MTNIPGQLFPLLDLKSAILLASTISKLENLLFLP